MPQNLKKQLLLAGMQDGHYEDIVTAHSDFSSIDDGLVKKVVAQGVEFNRLPQSALTESIQTVLQQRLYLMDNGYFTNAAYILFGKNLKKEYSQCFIKLAHFSGNTLLSTMLDHQQRYGNAFEVLAVAMRFIQNNMKVSSEFTADDIRRKDKPQIPVLAIRELIVNAICHRDYSDRYGEISLSIFSDRFEIWNNGKLHGGLTPEKLKVTHVSKRINPKIAEVFYFCGYIDRWGMGTLRVLEQCKKIGLPEPDFKEKDGGILVTIYFAERESTLEKSPQHIKYEGLTERQRLILECTWTDKEMKFPEIQKKLALNISDKTLRNELSILKELGLIELVGRGQYARWVVKTQAWPSNEG